MAFDYDFVGVGGLAYDLVLRINDLPIADEKYPARLIGKLPGGFIANATCAAAQLDLNTGYVGWIGDDDDGTMLHDDFLHWGVKPVGLVRVPGHPTPFTVVITDDQAHRAILLPMSPLYDLPLTPAQLGIISRARAVLTFPRDLEWFGHLRSRTLESDGLLVLDVENASPMQGLELLQVLRMSDIVFIKRSVLSSFGIYSLADLVAPGQWLIMTSGGSGSYGIEHGMREPLFQPGQTVQAVDTTGAGDCFHAALIAARLDGMSLGAALSFANAAAAIKVQHHGARTGLPTREEIEARL